MSPTDRAALHAALDEVLDRRPVLSSIEGDGPSPDARRRIESQSYCRRVLAFARDVAGLEAVRHAVQHERGGALTVAGHMLDMTTAFFGDDALEPSVAEVAFDLEAVDQGSLPKWIKPGPRNRSARSNEYYLRHHQLGAHCWIVRLRALGFSAEKSQDLVKDSFGKSRSAIRGWLPLVRQAFGDFRVDAALHLARVNATIMEPTDPAVLLEALSEAGRAYNAEEAAGVKMRD